MHVRLRMQLAEALGPDNRWFCSQVHGRTVDDPETLLCYFIRSGGADDFADRYAEAMAAPNRWYCSEHYRREIADEEILWKYYCSRCRRSIGRTRAGSRVDSQHACAALV